MAFSLSNLTAALEFLNPPADWRVERDSDLSLLAGGKTDLFFDPAGSSRMDNAPAALFVTRDENFMLKARVEVEFASTFDAGALLVRVTDRGWGKLCFEYSPQKQPMIVSVVTRTVSDDCNSVILDRTDVHLRVARMGQAFAFHYSTDGSYWHLVRHFGLGELDQVQVGFSVQSPTGHGCAAHFSAVEYQPLLLSDIRSGA